MNPVTIPQHALIGGCEIMATFDLFLCAHGHNLSVFHDRHLLRHYIIPRRGNRKHEGTQVRLIMKNQKRETNKIPNKQVVT